MWRLELAYATRVSTPSDINEHLPTLRQYATNCTTVVECGVRSIVSSYAFACGLNGKKGATLTMIDPGISPHMHDFITVCRSNNINASFIHGSDIECPPVETDLLFIDTFHVYGQLKRELAHWHSSVKKYIIMHDTTVDEWHGEAVRQSLNVQKASAETGIPVDEITRGLWPAIEEFLAEHSEWRLKARYTNNNGLTVLERV
jgi:hypothetical protein